MSLEHALLDRLEKRSLQIAQQENEIHGLRQLVNEKMSINEQLAEQITTARLEREQMQHQISELRTERDRILEVSKTLVPKSALKQAVQEAAELQSEAAKLVEENKKLASALEAASSEAKKDRAMYVDEQRRANGLDRQLAAACEDSNRKDREIGALMNEAGDLLTHSFELGRNNGENVKQFLDRICAEVPLESTREALKNAVAKLQEVTTDRDRLQNEMNALHREANKRGLIDRDLVAVIRKGWEDADRAAQLEIELRNEIKNHGDMRNEAQAIRAEVLAIGEERHRLQNEIARLNAKLGPLEALYKTLKGYHDSDKIIGHHSIIKVAIDVATEALSQLTA